MNTSLDGQDTKDFTIERQILFKKTFTVTSYQRNSMKKCQNHYLFIKRRKSKSFMSVLSIHEGSLLKKFKYYMALILKNLNLLMFFQTVFVLEL